MDYSDGFWTQLLLVLLEPGNRKYCRSIPQIHAILRRLDNPRRDRVFDRIYGRLLIQQDFKCYDILQEQLELFARNIDKTFKRLPLIKQLYQHFINFKQEEYERSLLVLAQSKEILKLPDLRDFFTYIGQNQLYHQLRSGTYRRQHFPLLKEVRAKFLPVVLFEHPDSSLSFGQYIPELSSRSEQILNNNLSLN